MPGPRKFALPKVSQLTRVQQGDQPARDRRRAAEELRRQANTAPEAQPVRHLPASQGRPGLPVVAVVDPEDPRRGTLTRDPRSVQGSPQHLTRAGETAPFMEMIRNRIMTDMEPDNPPSRPEYQGLREVDQEGGRLFGGGALLQGRLPIQAARGVGRLMGIQPLPPSTSSHRPRSAPQQTYLPETPEGDRDDRAIERLRRRSARR